MDVRRDIFQKGNSDTMHASARLKKMIMATAPLLNHTAGGDRGQIPFQDPFKPEQIYTAPVFLSSGLQHGRMLQDPRTGPVQQEWKGRREEYAGNRIAS